MEEIKRNQMLADMDIRLAMNGKRRTFSIKFVGRNGKLYYFPNAFACGVANTNMKKARVRGVQPCDCQGNPEGHIYPVGIDFIIEFKGKKIIF